MSILERFQEAQRNAPSYFIINPDGASMMCGECKVESTNEVFVKTFTPDGKVHYACHLSCIDEDWIAKAKNMGKI